MFTGRTQTLPSAIDQGSAENTDNLTKDNIEKRHQVSRTDNKRASIAEEIKENCLKRT